MPAGPDGSLDLEALSRCLARLKKKFPDADGATIKATAKTPAEVVVDVSEVLRSAADGPLFPSLSYGVPGKL